MLLITTYHICSFNCEFKRDRVHNTSAQLTVGTSCSPPTTNLSNFIPFLLKPFLAEMVFITDEFLVTMVYICLWREIETKLHSSVMTYICMDYSINLNPIVELASMYANLLRIGVHTHQSSSTHQL